MREGAWWAHSEEPIVPLMLLSSASGRRFVCLPCGRAVHFDSSRQGWRHYQHRVWRGHRKGHR